MCTLAHVQVTFIGYVHLDSYFSLEFHAYIKYFLKHMNIFLELMNIRPSP